jgi:hypothetical protein
MTDAPDSAALDIAVGVKGIDRSTAAPRRLHLKGEHLDLIEIELQLLHGLPEVN